MRLRKDTHGLVLPAADQLQLGRSRETAESCAGLVTARGDVLLQLGRSRETAERQRWRIAS